MLFALDLLLGLVNGYDCGDLVNNECNEGDSSSLSIYASCMVQQYSVFAFIQCASQNNGPDFSAEDFDGGANDISPIDVLIKGLSLAESNGIVAPACECPLAEKILEAANEHGAQNSAKYLCDQYDSRDAGLYCLRASNMSKQREHSIQAFGSGKYQDLMNAPTLPDSCSSDSSGGTSVGSDDEDTPPAAASSSDDSSSPEEATTSSATPAQTASSSTTPTTSPTANNATPTSSTTTSPTPQATSKGAASGRQVTYFDLMNRLGLTLLPILAIF